MVYLGEHIICAYKECSPRLLGIKSVTINYTKVGDCIVQIL